MRTSRSLTVCRSLLPGVVSAQGGGRSAPRGIVSALGGVCSWGVCLLRGVSAPRECLLYGGVCSRGHVCSWGVCLLWGCLLWGGVCSQGVCLLWGVSAPGGVSALGGICSWGGLLRGEGVVSQHALRQTPPTVNRITHTCKNITLAQLRCGR